MSRRRGSRLFSGHPGLILVSEDIPGITMPAPPVNIAPLEEEEPDFDLMSFRQEEDEEEAAESHDGPLRVFLGGDQAPTPVVAEEDESPVFDVSALAMPAGPYDESDDDDSLRFMDDEDDFDASDVVDLDGAPPPVLAMGVSAAVSLDDASAWDDSPTQPGPAETSELSTAVIRDTPPVVQATLGDPVELPDDPFSIDDPAVPALAAEDEPTALEPGGPADVVWDEDDKPVEGASISGFWVYPVNKNNNTSLFVGSTTASDGYATFTLDSSRPGDYRLNIEQVSKDGFEFDYDGSILVGRFTRPKK